MKIRNVLLDNEKNLLNIYFQIEVNQVIFINQINKVN